MSGPPLYHSSIEDEAHLVRETEVGIEEPPADAEDVRASVEQLYGVGVERLEDAALAHADLEVYQGRLASQSRYLDQSG